MASEEIREVLRGLKETQTRREDKQLDAAINAYKNGYSDHVILRILNGEIKIDPSAIPAPVGDSFDNTAGKENDGADYN